MSMLYVYYELDGLGWAACFGDMFFCLRQGWAPRFIAEEQVGVAILFSYNSRAAKLTGTQVN